MWWRARFGRVLQVVHMGACNLKPVEWPRWVVNSAAAQASCARRDRDEAFSAADRSLFTTERYYACATPSATIQARAQDHLGRQSWVSLRTVPMVEIQVALVVPGDDVGTG